MKIKVKTCKGVTICVCCVLSHIQLCVTLWTVAYQAPRSMGFCKARILVWVAMPSSRDLHHPGIKPMSLHSPELAHRFSYHSCYLGSHDIQRSLQ